MLQATRRSLVDLMAHHCQSLDLASTAEHARLQLNLISSLLSGSLAATPDDSPCWDSHATTGARFLAHETSAAEGSVSLLSDSQATTGAHFVTPKNPAATGKHAGPGQQAVHLTQRWWQAYMQQIKQAVAGKQEVELLYEVAPLCSLLGTLSALQSQASQLMLQIALSSRQLLLAH